MFNFINFRSGWLGMLDFDSIPIKCNCFVGCRGKACKHNVMLMVRNRLVEYPPEVKAELIEKKRKPGRPKKARGGEALKRN
jgi:hypothetical protein